MILKVKNKVRPINNQDDSWKAKDILFKIKSKLPRFIFKNTHFFDGVEIDIDDDDLDIFDQKLSSQGLSYEKND